MKLTKKEIGVLYSLIQDVRDSESLQNELNFSYTESIKLKNKLGEMYEK